MISITTFFVNAKFFKRLQKLCETTQTFCKQMQRFSGKCKHFASTKFLRETQKFCERTPKIFELIQGFCGTENLASTMFIGRSILGEHKCFASKSIVSQGTTDVLQENVKFLGGAKHFLRTNAKFLGLEQKMEKH